MESYTVKPPLHTYAASGQTRQPADIVLSAEQQAVYDRMVAALGEGMHCFLLHGVTGSGKTSVFIRLIDTVVQRGKQVILLVPEIALTPQIVEQFYQLFGNIVAVIHSELSLGQRSETWRSIASGAVKIIIGTRSAVFAPVQNLGLIVVDEEGERTYKSDSAPRYHAISVAKKRCQTHHCPLLLASATPSVESYYFAKRGIYTLLEMHQRYNQTPLPHVEVVDMQEERTLGKEGMFSETLAQALRDNLESGSQSLLLLNRRGYHTIISCASCNQPVYCPNCSIPMTYHKVNNSLMCHYCGHTQDMVETCPSCGGKHLRKMGFGTQRLEEELRLIVPEARILRMDADTMTAKGAHERLLNKFGKGEADILIGTQMVTKGLDFENVTLVGVLDADQSLYAQDYRARERTFSLITQVVGRAGRRFDTGRAVIQTYSPLHPVILTAARQDYEAFYESEMQTREALRCPPVCDITMITAVGELEQQVLSSLLALKTRLQSLMEGQFADVKAPVLGPAAAQMVKVMGRYRYHLTIRAKDCARWRRLISGVLREFMQDGKNRGVTVFADSNNEM